jgi:hypothetical protein
MDGFSSSLYAENQKPTNFHFPTILKSKKQKRLRFRSQVNSSSFFKIEKTLRRRVRRLKYKSACATK